MIALLDGPWGLHGSTPGEHTGARRIIRCHVRVDAAHVRRAYDRGAGEEFRAALSTIARGETAGGPFVNAFRRDIRAPREWGTKGR